MSIKFQVMLKLQLQMMRIVLVGGLFGWLVLVAGNLFDGSGAIGGWSLEFIALYLAAILGYIATPWALGAAFQNGVSRQLFLRTAAVGLGLCAILMSGFVTIAGSLLASDGGFLAATYHLSGAGGIVLGAVMRVVAYLAIAALGVASGFWTLPWLGKARFAFVFVIYGVMVLPGIILAVVLEAAPNLPARSGGLRGWLALVGLPWHAAPQPWRLLVLLLVLLLGGGALAVHLGRHVELTDRI
ncbi:hypothetical protein [Lacticaseibacillus nasuensis]|uniref:hypothetical protein n=1 Tax=Lacticaseibacillus nasuensis TaxID=944671 RepID=UPI00224569C3|nr:hypothetical protein [Lacticaseibacillus nasuensis]MCX2454634.1 hypothetical protein [Lacticaseibacillus nasuensis]